MAIALYFNPPAGMTASTYDDIIKRLDAAGAGSPKGRVHHSCFGPPDHLMVYDVWSSQEEFDAFGETLIPIMQEIGIDPGTPDVMPVHNLVQ